MNCRCDHGNLSSESSRGKSKRMGYVTELKAMTGEVVEIIRE